LNFGFFATPERNLVFDLNDFDETLLAPWEWDVKRLAASFVVAARDQHLSKDECLNSAVACDLPPRTVPSSKLDVHMSKDPLQRPARAQRKQVSAADAPPGPGGDIARAQ